ncbi:MAG: AsmA-like C-terminal region-containing protein [Planctomycetota bacterium]
MPSVLKGRVRRRGRRIWGWFLEFVLTAAVMWMSLVFAGRVLPKIALRQISELTNTRIEAGSVDFRFDGSVYINDLTVWPKVSAGYDNSILKAETVRVHFRVGSLMTFRPRLKEIFVKYFVLRALCDSDSGRWNLSSLRVEMPGGAGGRLPLVWFENGRVEYIKAAGGRVRVVKDWPVSGDFLPAERNVCKGGYVFYIYPESRRDLKKSINGNWCPGKIVVGWRASSKDVPGFERPWTMVLDTNLSYEPNGSYELAAKVKDLNFPPSPGAPGRKLFSFETQSVAEKAPFIEALQKFFNRYSPSGRIDMDLHASGNLSSIIESKIAGTVYCSDAAVCDGNFAYPVEHITGQIELTEKSARLEDLAGRHGEVELVLSGWASDFGPDWKYRLQITSDNMLLDKDLYDALGRDAQRFWTAFSPKGTAAINYSRGRLSATDKQTAIAVELLDVESKYAGFGYPLKHTRGKLFFGAGSIEFSDVISEWEGRKITINGKANLGQGEKPTYDVLVEGKGIPLDSTLEEALPAAQRDIYNQFEMAGLIDATIKIFNPQGGQGAGSFTAEVFPKGSSIKAQALPIVVSDVTGKIIFEPNDVNIDNLTGRFGTGMVGFSGHVWPAGKEQGLDYCLSMQAERIELKNEELIGALPGSLGVMVTALRPGGEVNLTADVGTKADGNCVGNRLIIECLGNTIDCNLLPYPLRDISGRLVMTQNQIEFEDIKAKAVHKSHGEPVESAMKMAGKVVLGEEQVKGEGMEITAGEIKFYGEQVRFKDKSFEKMDTVLRYDPESKSWLSRYFIADFYDGKMIGKLQLNQSREGGLDYLLEASVAGADLKKFLSDKPEEMRPEEHYSTGTINGSLSIVGSIVDNRIRLGRCRLKIIDMEVGKLSPLAKLLQVLNLTESGDYAFDQMVVDAYIQDNKVFLRQIDLSGKSLAFYGSGRLDLETDDINLTLTARGRRLAAKKPSILESLTEGLGRAVVRVEVKGKANDPQVTTRSLPVIGETLEILGTPRQE